MLPHNRSFQLSPGTRVAVLSRRAGTPVAGFVFGDTTTYTVSPGMANCRRARACWAM
jgi:hypothetical protein